MDESSSRVDADARFALVLTSARRVLSPEQPRQVLGPKSTGTGDGPVRQAGRPRSGATRPRLAAHVNTSACRIRWVDVL